MSKATRKKAMRLKAAHAHLYTPLVHQPPPPYPSHLLLITDTQRLPDLHQHLLVQIQLRKYPVSLICWQICIKEMLSQWERHRGTYLLKMMMGMEWMIWLLSMMAMSWWKVYLALKST